MKNENIEFLLKKSNMLHQKLNLKKFDKKLYKIYLSKKF